MHENWRRSVYIILVLAHKPDPTQSTFQSTIDLYLIPETLIGSNSTSSSLSTIERRDKTVEGKFSAQTSKYRSPPELARP
jgi:hypothetical protein